MQPANVRMDERMLKRYAKDGTVDHKSDVRSISSELEDLVSQLPGVKSWGMLQKPDNPKKRADVHRQVIEELGKSPLAVECTGGPESRQSPKWIATEPMKTEACAGICFDGFGRAESGAVVWWACFQCRGSVLGD